MKRDRTILHTGVAGALCFVLGIVLAGVAVAGGGTPILPIGLAVLGMLLVAAALEHRRRAADAVDDAPPSGDLA